MTGVRVGTEAIRRARRRKGGSCDVSRGLVAGTSELNMLHLATSTGVLRDAEAHVSLYDGDGRLPQAVDLR